MSRWAPDAALRLEAAALALFAEQGFEATTVPQIAREAGLTTRTFFRHFADKRDVLFLRDREFPAVVAALMARAPAGLAPLDLVLWGFAAMSPEFTEWREAIAKRRAVIRADGRLRERELLKADGLAEAVRGALVAAGTPPLEADLAARIGGVLFDASLTAWLADGSRSFADVVREVGELAAAAIGTPSQV